MLVYILSRFLNLLFGLLYPAYSSFLVIKNKDAKGYVQWMMYWIVFAFYTTFETVGDFIFGQWFPFYYEIKILIILWLVVPSLGGAGVIYKNIIHPKLVHYDPMIQIFILNLKESLSLLCYRWISTAFKTFSYAISHALLQATIYLQTGRTYQPQIADSILSTSNLAPYNDRSFSPFGSFFTTVPNQILALQFQQENLTQQSQSDTSLVNRIVKNQKNENIFKNMETSNIKRGNTIPRTKKKVRSTSIKVKRRNFVYRIPAHYRASYPPKVFVEESETLTPTYSNSEDDDIFYDADEGNVNTQQPNRPNRRLEKLNVVVAEKKVLKGFLDKSSEELTISQIQNEASNQYFQLSPSQLSLDRKGTQKSSQSSLKKFFLPFYSNKTSGKTNDCE